MPILSLAGPNLELAAHALWAPCHEKAAQAATMPAAIVLSCCSKLQTASRLHSLCTSGDLCKGVIAEIRAREAGWRTACAVLLSSCAMKADPQSGSISCCLIVVLPTSLLMHA